jgi:hypothetical protein
LFFNKYTVLISNPDPKTNLSLNLIGFPGWS